MSETKTPTATKPLLFYICGMFLLVSIAASLVLSGTKLGVITSLPGCGVGSGCDAITNGPWGTVPVVGWPVSFVGAAWFSMLFVGWVRGLSKERVYLWIVRVGVLGSVGFFIVMLSVGHFCKWCALAHMCNILFCVFAEINTRRGVALGSSKKHFCFMVCVFVVVTVMLGATRFFVSSYQRGLDEIAGGENVEEVVRGDSSDSTLKLLEATHRIGPENAPVQIVIFTDYQCPDCKQRERELAAVVSQRDDVSLSVKHFPMCAACNVYMNGRTMHANACWAARAAEAAGIIGGDDKWEQMHTWLFEQGGSFTDKTFSNDLESMGFDPQQFLSIMMGDETLLRVQEDINDAKSLGIKFTPMIFINGVEYLWYYGGRQESIASLVDRASVYISGGGEMAEPPSATKKLVEDWRRGKVHRTGGTGNQSWTGDGPVEFVVWGDYQSQFTRDLEKDVQQFLKENTSKARYSFRAFPMDVLCNKSVVNASKKHPGSCYLSKLVEAVAVLSGNDSGWEMHNWILGQPSPVDIRSAELHASTLVDVDLGVLKSFALGNDINNKIQGDILAKNKIWRRSIPVITIDDRLLPWWDSDEITTVELFHLIVDVVSKEGSEEDSR